MGKLRGAPALRSIGRQSLARQALVNADEQFKSQAERRRDCGGALQRRLPVHRGIHDYQDALRLGHGRNPQHFPQERCTQSILRARAVP